MVQFVKGDVKEEIARRYFRKAEREDRFGVVMIGVAQETASAWRGWRDGGPDGHPHFEYRRQSVFPNHYYFYIRDPDWGPAFIKTIAYAPFPVWIYLNGNEWAKRQAAQQGIAFEALDNGFRSVRGPTGARRDLQAALSARCAGVLRAGRRAALAVHRRGPPARLRLRALVPPAGDLRHPRVRPARRGPRLV